MEAATKGYRWRVVWTDERGVERCTYRGNDEDRARDDAIGFGGERDTVTVYYHDEKTGDVTVVSHRTGNVWDIDRWPVYSWM